MLRLVHGYISEGIGEWLNQSHGYRLTVLTCD